MMTNLSGCDKIAELMESQFVDLKMFILIVNELDLFRMYPKGFEIIY